MTQSPPGCQHGNKRPLPQRGKGPLRACLIVLVVALMSVGCTSGDDDPSSEPKTATTTPQPVTWLVTVGDSYISGEGARWAGNTSGEPGPVDALGPTAYGPDGSASQRGCHRASLSVAVASTELLRGKNLACSGATTRSHGSGDSFKPGLDWYDDGQGRVGQLRSLQVFAKRHAVSAVAVSIGGNDFDFGPVVAGCVSAFLASLGMDPVYCKDNPQIRAVISRAHVARVTRHITAAIHRVGAAMAAAGYQPGDYRVVVQNYPSPLPSAGGFRYRETLLNRFLVGGCAFYDKDASWANSRLLATINRSVRVAVRRSHLSNVTRVDMTEAFAGHRLCERGAGQLEETNLASWRSPEAMDALEWVNMIYTKSDPWQLQESLHPNFWGTQVMRTCVRESLDNENARSGRCQDGRFVVQ